MSAPLVVFDIDGTLLRSELVTVPAVRDILVEYGLPVPESGEITAFFGQPVEAYHAWLMAQCPPELAQEIVVRVDRRELECIGEHGELYAGVIELLEQLTAEGATLAICSNGPDDYVGEFLDAHAVRHFFSVVQCRGERGIGKTEMLGELLDVLPARPAIVVGDRIDDVASAHAHGARAIGAAYGFGAPGELSGADAVVQAPREISAIIARFA